MVRVPKIATIVGARPQFIKAAALSAALAAAGHDENTSPPLEEVLIHTGQHYDHSMSEAFFEELPLPKPTHNLGVGSGDRLNQISEMLTRIQAPLVQEAPDAVLVYGDTNSTLAGALAAATLGIPLVHVEAGLRSYNPTMPEEMNRRLTDHASSVLYCPSQHSKDNLQREGISDGVNVVGDVMYDVFLSQFERVPKGAAQELGVENGTYVVVTIHRAGNTDDPERLTNLFEGLRRIASTGLRVIFPAHPRTLAASISHGLSIPPELTVISPLPHAEMLALQASAAAVLTDSGGMQKEAYWLGIPCVTLRDETEWMETVDSGWNQLVGTDPNKIESAVHATPPRARPELYGDGRAAQRIISHLFEWLSS